MSENYDRMAVAFARMAVAFARGPASKFPRKLIFQRYPIEGESRVDERGFPKETTTDLQNVAGAIPCNYTTQAGREVVIAGQPRTTTLYKFIIPRLYLNSESVWSLVDFSTLYKVKLLSKGVFPEQQLEITSGGSDPGPAILFEAVLFES